MKNIIQTKVQKHQPLKRTYRILKNSKEFLEHLKSTHFNRVHSIKAFDFSTLYTTIPHSKLRERLAKIISNAFTRKYGNRKYIFVVLNCDKTYFVKEKSDSKSKYTETDTIQILNFPIDNIFVVFGGKVFQEFVEIPVGTNCAPFLKSSPRGLEAQSITEWITSYIVHPSCGSRLDYTLNIVDMPGFGDTRGIDYDEKTVRQLKHLFTSASADGLSQIDAVCFLLKASDVRLTTTQSYIFDSILSVFGNDIAGNIFLMITFSDSFEKPRVLDAVSKKQGLKDKPYFLFNNCSLYSSNENIDDSPYFFWKKTTESFDKFFKNLSKVGSKSLKLSAKVLEQRETIEQTVLHLQHQIQLTLATICTLEKEIDLFTKHKNEIKDNENFEYEVEETQIVKEDISGLGIFTTTCLHCNYTCHDNCFYANDDDKKHCIAMDSDGECKFCPANCHWKHHSNVPWVFKYIQKKVKKTYAEKLERYKEADGRKLKQEDVIKKMGEEINKSENDIEHSMGIIADCNNTLKEIALNPSPLSTAEYIELMIESEKREKKSGFEERIAALKKCLERVQIDKTVAGARERIQKIRNMADLAQLNIGQKGWRGVQKIWGIIKNQF